MKPILYDCFKHWTNHGTIYIYSDPHFSDEESYKLRFAENFKNLYNPYNPDPADYITEVEVIENLDQMQIDNINKVCGKNDTLIILGDVGNIECVKKLKAGRKVLIMGNHDKGASNYKRYVDFYDGEADNHLFDEVYEGTLQISPKIILSHEPVDYRYCFNIHGHVHHVNPLGPYTERLASNLQPVGGWYNCCAESINYKPVNLKSIIQSGFLKNVPDIHRDTIERAKNTVFYLPFDINNDYEISLLYTYINKDESDFFPDKNLGFDQSIVRCIHEDHQFKIVFEPGNKVNYDKAKEEFNRLKLFQIDR